MIVSYVSWSKENMYIGLEMCSTCSTALYVCSLRTNLHIILRNLYVCMGTIRQPPRRYETQCERRHASNSKAEYGVVNMACMCARVLFTYSYHAQRIASFVIVQNIIIYMSSWENLKDSRKRVSDDSLLQVNLA